VTQRIGILGGTFDPIHCGHLDAAIAARDALALDRVLLVPSHVPPHRTARPVASPFHRFAMTALAVNGRDGLAANDDELRAGGHSYTADTLERLHAQGLAPSQIFFITGVDAFAEIDTWRRYPDVLDLAHFVVVSRPGYPAERLLHRLPALAARFRDAREAPRAGGQPSILLLDAPTQDVSATVIRERIRCGLSVAGLVPPAVDAHIHQHHLYHSGGRPRAGASQADELHGQD
jgi:nicotinate-nucleotide adenylyltransferase